MSKKPQSTSKKATKTQPVKKSNNSDDVMQNLMSTSLFDEPPKKKVEIKEPKRKDLEIDIDNDSQEDIIRKLVLNIKALEARLDAYEHYADGTFCTQAVHNRNFDSLEKKVDDLVTAVEDLS